MQNLQNPRLMLLKALLFLAIALTAATLLVIDNPTLKTVALILLIAWSTARAYYFAFYVITNYIDPTFKYAGLWSAFRHLTTHRKP